MLSHTDMLQSENEQETGPGEHCCQLGHGELLYCYFRHIKKPKLINYPLRKDLGLVKGKWFVVLFLIWVIFR